MQFADVAENNLFKRLLRLFKIVVWAPPPKLGKGQKPVFGFKIVIAHGVLSPVLTGRVVITN